MLQNNWLEEGLEFALNYWMKRPWKALNFFRSSGAGTLRSKPGSRIVGSATKVELTTVADCQSSLHQLVTSIICKSLHSGLCDSRRSVGGRKSERRHHIMANHGDIKRALSTCLWQLCIVELVVQYLWGWATMVMELTGWCQRWGARRNAVGHLQG